MELRPGTHDDRQAAGPATAAHVGDQPLTALVASARQGENAAWAELFNRFEPLVRSVCRRYRLSGTDADDVSQAVWLKLFEHVGDLREPRALPGWIATTTSHQCLREVDQRRRLVVLDPQDAEWAQVDGSSLTARTATDGAVDERILREEDRRAVQEDLSGLSAKEQGLLVRLMADPPVPYTEISRQLDMPVGSIGPTRARCLEKLRRGPAVGALVGAAPGHAGVAA